MHKLCTKLQLLLNRNKDFKKKKFEGKTENSFILQRAQMKQGSKNTNKENRNQGEEIGSEERVVQVLAKDDKEKGQMNSGKEVFEQFSVLKK